MSDQSHSSFGGDSKNIGGIRESETQRLQREVDQFTRDLEQERHRLVTLDQQIKQVQQELDEKTESNQKKKPTAFQAKKQNIQHNYQKKKIINEREKLNQTKAQNKDYRRQIDVLRTELISATNEQNRLIADTKRVKREAQEQNKLQLLSNQQAEQHITQCIALRAKHEDDKEAFEIKIKTMRQKLQEEDDDMTDVKKDKTADKNDQDKKQSVGDFSNHINVIRLRLAKIIATNKQKKRLLDQYIRNVSAMKDAFEQIQKETGKSPISEIVIDFIKAEEQNYSLYNFQNMLSTETDMLEESNREIKEQIDRIIERGKLTDEQRDNLRQQMSTECKDLTESINAASAETEASRRMFRKVQQHVEMMVEMFKRCRFYLSVATQMNYDEGFVFSESNIVSFLAELEEYICALITYTAFKRDDPQAAIAAIPLEKLFPKDYGKKDLAINAPQNPDVDLVDAKFLNDGQIPDEEMVFIDGKSVYANFQKMLKQGDGDDHDIGDRAGNISDE